MQSLFLFFIFASPMKENLLNFRLLLQQQQQRQQQVAKTKFLQRKDQRVTKSWATAEFKNRDRGGRIRIPGASYSPAILETPITVQTLALSSIGPEQYLNGRPLGSIVCYCHCFRYQCSLERIISLESRSHPPPPTTGGCRVPGS